MALVWVVVVAQVAEDWKIENGPSLNPAALIFSFSSISHHCSRKNEIALFSLNDGENLGHEI